MNNIMYLFIGDVYTVDNFCKHTLIVIYDIIFKKCLMHGVPLSGSVCSNPAYLSRRGKGEAEDLETPQASKIQSPKYPHQKKFFDGSTHYNDIIHNTL